MLQGLQLDFSAEIGKLGSKVDRLVALMERDQIMRPHPARAITALSPVAAFTALSQLTAIGSPPGGMNWSVERVSFGMNAGGTVTTQGTMIVFIGSNEVARTTTIPNFLTFSRFQCLVTPNDDLMAVWVGGAVGANSSMIVDVSASEYPILGRLREDA